MSEVEAGTEKGGTPPFDWAVYADATFAGLSILIPIPMVDLAFEALFRRRMPRTIAACHRRTLASTTVQALNHSEWSARGCLLLPLKLVVTLGKRLFRTVFYFLTVKEATDNLSFYWQRAFLIDLSLRRGHLDDVQRAGAAVGAIEGVLDDLRTSPVETLAAQIVGSVRQVLRTVFLWARRKIQTDVARETQQKMERGWEGLQAHLAQAGALYEAGFERRLADLRRAEAAAIAPPAMPPETESRSDVSDRPPGRK